MAQPCHKQQKINIVWDSMLAPKNKNKHQLIDWLIAQPVKSASQVYKMVINDAYELDYMWVIPCQIIQ